MKRASKGFSSSSPESGFKPVLHHFRLGPDYSSVLFFGSLKLATCTNAGGGHIVLSHPRIWLELILFFPNLLAIALPRERFFYSLLLAWFQVEGVALHFLDDVFRLHFALKTPQCILKGFAFLDTYFCQD